MTVILLFVDKETFDLVNKNYPKITCAEAQVTIYQTDIKLMRFLVQRKMVLN